nr:hypothetical protein [uncultured Dysosmobacter sp.]
MTQRRWNLLTTVSLAATLAGFLLVRSGLSWGKAVIVLGCAAFVASLLGSSRRSATHPPRCPQCGQPLIPAGRRYGGGVWGIQELDQLHCPHCAAMVSTRDLPDQ